MQSQIITIDGGSASGKGTIARMLAKEFNFNYLNSGALYRIVAYECKEKNIQKDKIKEIVKIGQNIAPIFLDEQVILNGTDIWPVIRTEEIGKLASEISPVPELRQALFDFQRSCADIKNAPHGLVAEGRDMGTKIFPESKIKIFLNASPETQAKRRLKDELAHDPSATYENILEKIQMRDKRDKERAHGALTIVPDALIINTDSLNIREVFEMAKNYCEQRMKNIS